MRTLSIDIETYSSTDLSKSGVYKYTEAADYEILLFAYCFDDEPVRVVDLTTFEELPDEVTDGLFDPEILKTAFNANFEISNINKFFSINLPKEQWQCTMVKSAMLGLPMSLDQVSKVLKLEEGKDAKGKALIRYFTMPCKPTAKNEMRTRNLPHHDLEKWELFKNYCVQDVVVERAILKKISFFEIPDAEKKLWQLDQKINDYGVKIDMDLVNNAIAFDENYRERLVAEAGHLTGLDNPNSIAQLKEWLSKETGEAVTSLTKETVKEMLEGGNDEIVEKVLSIRQEMSKSSVKKYQAMLNCVCADGRVRGLFQYGGASKTLRWSSRLLQIQNLPRNYLRDLDLARKLVVSGDLDLFELLFGNVPDTLSQLIRTAIVATDGELIVSDFSAIEARVIAWLAGEKWRMDVFNTHGKIYEASAAQMFKVPYESITKDSPLRQKGKVSELALGYQGGVNALITMGALKQGLTEEELPSIVKAWRAASPKIVNLWKALNNAAIETMQGNPTKTHGLQFSKSNGILWMQLPSGRSLAYFNPSIEEGEYGARIMHYGMNQTTRKWEKQTTYGGKLAENATQAIARDCLADAMIRADAAGYRIGGHVHDEIIADGGGTLEELDKILSQRMPWAKDLPLGAAGFTNYYYKKD